LQKRFSAAECQALLQAALLHDCGKISHPPTLLQRVLLVVYEAAPPLLRRLPVWESPVCLEARLIGAEHAARGREMACEAGLDVLAQELIAAHHQPRSELARLLADADDRC
jgi:hypothetical protein